MMVDLLVLALLKAQVAASVAILIVLALRLPARRLIGAELSYRLWVLAPAAALASLFPTLPEFEARMNRAPSGLVTTLSTLKVPVLHHASELGYAWLAGAAVLAALFALAQGRFLRRARAGQAGPAVTGAWPRMVVPSDYRARFTEAERALIREHERAHMDRGDLAASLLIAVCQVVGWFNPLMHVAAACARMDQELACDAQVIAAHPRSRRRYAETLLKAHDRGWSSPLTCALALGGRHPLEVRLTLMLGARRISVKRDRAGVFVVGALAVGLAAALWTWAPV
jgi:beta-lactamase regulating signal transducer with metallopeptidase domain